MRHSRARSCLGTSLPTPHAGLRPGFAAAMVLPRGLAGAGALVILSGCFDPAVGATDPTDGTESSGQVVDTTINEGAGESGKPPMATSSDGTSGGMDGESSLSTAASCGDGIIQEDEECDLADDNSDNGGCTSTCRLAVCGDGILHIGEEECDAAGESDACNSNCTVSTCGDGVVNAAAMEECDDQGESATCNANCRVSVCGDGVLNATAGEACDDQGESARCNAECTASSCGDGVINATAMEECEDGNAVDFDFCDNMCLSAPAMVLEATHVFNTQTGTLDGIPQTNWDPVTSTWYLSMLEITGTGILTVIGPTALTLRVEGDVLIAGLLDVSGGNGGSPTGVSCTGAGSGGARGPGGFNGGAGAGNGGSGTENGQAGQAPGGAAQAQGGVASTALGTFNAGAGGGGGGHQTSGDAGQGSNGCIGGVGGGAYVSLPPLIGGGGGGGGSVEKDSPVGAGLAIDDDEGTGGGGGGGAVGIYSTTAITVVGTIDASGGDGGTDGDCGEDVSFGGGGAGGSILLDSPATDVMMGVLDVSGGQGGQSISPSARDGGDGADGHIVIT